MDNNNKFLTKESLKDSFKELYKDYNKTNIKDINELEEKIRKLYINKVSNEDFKGALEELKYINTKMQGIMSKKLEKNDLNELKDKDLRLEKLIQEDDEKFTKLYQNILKQLSLISNELNRKIENKNLDELRKKDLNLERRINEDNDKFSKLFRELRIQILKIQTELLEKDEKIEDMIVKKLDSNTYNKYVESNNINIDKIKRELETKVGNPELESLDIKIDYKLDKLDFFKEQVKIYNYIENFVIYPKIYNLNFVYPTNINPYPLIIPSYKYIEPAIIWKTNIEMIGGTEYIGSAIFTNPINYLLECVYKKNYFNLSIEDLEYYSNLDLWEDKDNYPDCDPTCMACTFYPIPFVRIIATKLSEINPVTCECLNIPIISDIQKFNNLSLFNYDCYLHNYKETINLPFSMSFLKNLKGKYNLEIQICFYFNIDFITDVIEWNPGNYNQKIINSYIKIEKVTTNFSNLNNINENSC